MTPTQQPLPRQIFEMIGLLHQSGYTNIYLYSGLSPSGLNWRFNIGYLDNGAWPSYRVITNGSVGSKGDVVWCKAPQNPQGLFESFVNYYQIEKPPHERNNMAYVRWLTELKNMLSDNEAPVFYADYPAPHQHLLVSAPGYRS